MTGVTSPIPLETKAYRRRCGITKIFVGLGGGLVLIGIACYVLPTLGQNIGLLGAAAVILQLGYGLTGIYEVATGRPWQRLEDKWNSLTPAGRGFWGTVIVIAGCVVLAGFVMLAAYIFRPAVHQKQAVVPPSSIHRSDK